MSASSTDDDLDGRVSDSVVQVYARSTGLMMSRRHEAERYENAPGQAAAPRITSKSLKYRLSSSEYFETIARHNLMRLTDLETNYGLKKVEFHIQEVRNGVRDRGLLMFFSDILSWVRDPYSFYQKFQWWFATKLAVKRGREVSYEPAGLLRAYQRAACVNLCPGSLVLDGLLPMHSDSHFMPYMLLSEKVSLVMETSEGYVLRVTGHEIPGEVSIYTYEESFQPECFTQVRHLIGINVGTVEKLDLDCSAALCALLSDEAEHLRATIQSVVDARSEADRFSNDMLVMHQIVMDSFNIRTIERLAKDGRISAENICTELCRKIIAVLSCHKVDIVLPSSLGEIKLRAIASKKWGIDDPDFRTRGRLTSYNKPRGLTDSTSVFDYLVSEGVVRLRWVTHMIIESSYFMDTYGSADFTMVGTRYLSQSSWPIVPGLQDRPKFETDRAEDLEEYSDSLLLFFTRGQVQFQ